PVLELLDDGPGVQADQQQHIFEPFYTTDSKGTGLGLYISRELCESNQAHLAYHPRPEGGSCFRITFAHPRKMSWAPTPSLNNNKSKRSEEHTSELQSRENLVCRLLLEKKKKNWTK